MIFPSASEKVKWPSPGEVVDEDTSICADRLDPVRGPSPEPSRYDVDRLRADPWQPAEPWQAASEDDPWINGINLKPWKPDYYSGISDHLEENIRYRSRFCVRFMKERKK